MARDLMTSTKGQLLIVIWIALIFAGLSFSYSFVGFFSPEAKTIKRLDTVGSITPQEIGGHFLFGFIAGLPFRKLKMAVLCGLMALAVDADHILNAAGFEVQGRMSHSIPFMIITSVLIGMIATWLLNYSIRRNARHFIATTRRNNRGPNLRNGSRSRILLYIQFRDTFSQFLVITAAAVISHIAYDTLVDNEANFPLLAPFVYADINIPQIYGLPIEGSAILLVCFWDRAARRSMHTSQVRSI